MAWQSDEIQPYSSSPADDIFKIQNDLAVVKTILEGGYDPDVTVGLGGMFTGYNAVSTVTVAMDSTYLGKLTAFTGTSAGTWTLPAASAGSGKVLAIVNNSLKKLTMNRAGTDTMTVDGQSATSLVLQPGESIILVAAAGAVWYSLSYNRLPSDDINSISITVGNASGTTTANRAFVNLKNIKLYDDDGSALLCRSFSGAADIRDSGIGGLDANTTLTNGQFYSVYLVSDGVNFGLLLSNRSAVLTGNCTAGSPVVTGLSSTAQLRKNQRVMMGASYYLSGGVTAYDDDELRIVSIDSATQITLNKPAYLTTSYVVRADAIVTLPYGYSFYRKIGTIFYVGSGNKLALTAQKGAVTTRVQPAVLSVLNTTSGAANSAAANSLIANNYSLSNIRFRAFFYLSTASTTATSASVNFGSGQSYSLMTGWMGTNSGAQTIDFSSRSGGLYDTSGIMVSINLSLGTGGAGSVQLSVQGWTEDFQV